MLRMINKACLISNLTETNDGFCYNVYNGHDGGVLAQQRYPASLWAERQTMISFELMRFRMQFTFFLGGARFARTATIQKSARK